MYAMKSNQARLVACLFTILISLYLSGSGFGQTANATWVGGAGNWSNPSLWSCSPPPSPGNQCVPNDGTNGFSVFNVFIDGGNLAASPVTLDINSTINNLTVDSDDSLTISNNLFFQLTGNISNAGNILVNSTGSTTQLDASGTVTLTGTGTVTLSEPVPSESAFVTSFGTATLVNQSTIQGAGVIGGLNGGSNFTLTNQGTINANAPSQGNGILVIEANAGTNTGTMEASNGGILQFFTPANITNTGGTIEALGGTSPGTVILQDGVVITGGTLTTTGSAAIETPGGGNGTLNGVTNSGLYEGLDSSITTLLGTITNGGNILVNSTGSNTRLDVIGTATLTGTGTVTLSEPLTSESAFIGAAFGQTGTLVNQSTIQGAGVISNSDGVSFTLTNQGTINANAPSQAIVIVEPAGFSNKGKLIVSGGSTLQITNTSFSNFNSGTSTLTGGTYLVTGTLAFDNANIVTNAANITLTGTTSQIINNQTSANGLANFATNAGKGSFTLAGNQNLTTPGSFSNAGTIKVSKGSTFTVGGSGSYTQTGGKTTVDGTLITSSMASFRSGSLLNIGAGSISINGGSVFGNGGNLSANVTSSGTITPADSATKAGKLTVTGNYTQNSTGALDINIAGTTPGTKFNQLNVTGTASLNGTLNIGLLNGFVPTIGSTFKILTATSVTGTFTTVNGTSINSSEHFTVTVNPTNVTLTVVAGP